MRGLVDVRARESGFEVTHYEPRSTCRVVGCARKTQLHKPVCPDHVLALPYAAAVEAHPLAAPDGLVETTCSDCEETFEAGHGKDRPAAARCPGCRIIRDRAGERARAKASRARRAS
jgi:hypothetical protein